MRRFLSSPSVANAGLLILFAAPLLTGLLGRVLLHGWWLNDLDAVLCGAWRSAHHMSPYAADTACPGGQPARYMYLPQLAALLSPLARGPDITGLRLVFGVAHLAVLAFLFHALFLRPVDGAPTKLRAPFLAFTNGAALASANLAYACHALVLGAGLLRRRSPWLLVGAIVAVSVVKPIFLTYLVIFAYEDEAISTRAHRIAAGVATAAAASALVLVTGGPELAEWRTSLDQVVLGRETGYGLLTWLGWFGLRGTDPLGLAIYAAYAGLVFGAGLVIAETRRLTSEARFFLALGVAQLLNPRLMSYDLLMLAPLAAVFAAAPLGQRKAFQTLAFALGALGFIEQFTPLRDFIRLNPAWLVAALFAAAAACAKAALKAKPPRLPPGRSADAIRWRRT